MPVDELVTLAQEALVLAALVSLPVVGAVALGGLVVSVVQSVTRIESAAISHLPRLVIGALVLSLTAPWMGAQIARFAARALSAGS
jgi:type III secretion protein S